MRPASRMGPESVSVTTGRWVSWLMGYLSLSWRPQMYEVMSCFLVFYKLVAHGAISWWTVLIPIFWHWGATLVTGLVLGAILFVTLFVKAFRRVSNG